MSKLGVAAPTSADLLDLDLVSGAGGGDSKEVAQELLRRQQVQEFVSKLSPEQVALQQQRVQVRERCVINFTMFDKKIFSEGLLMVLQLWMACVISFNKLWLSVKFLLVLSFSF